MAEKTTQPSIPGIGEIRGFFEIFLPGGFLLTNLVLVAYFFQGYDSHTKDFLDFLGGHEGIGAAVAVPISYLFGVCLRLLRTSSADELSAHCIRLTAVLLRPELREARKSFAGERFPYPKTIGQRWENLPHDALEFYGQYWSAEGGQRRDLTSFDFYKSVVESINERAAKEVSAAEALTRHSASMCYALMVSLIFLVVPVVIRLVRHEFSVLLVCLFSGYFLAFLGVIWNLRFLRAYEVETVIALSFIYRKEFKEIIGVPSATGSSDGSPLGAALAATARTG